jgi:hypothetical protein
VHRDNRYEQRTILDLPSDRAVPGIATAQFALIEPDIDTDCAQGFADALRGLSILGGVADENGLVAIIHGERIVLS